MEVSENTRKGEDGKGIVEWGLTSEERVEAHGGSVDVDAAVGDGDEDVVVDVAAGAGGVDGDVGAAAPPPLPPLLPPALSLLRGCQLVCNVQCNNVGAGASLSLCSALCTIGASRARAGSGARMAGIRDELRTSRPAAGAAIGPAVASVGGAAIAPRAIRVCSQRLFTVLSGISHTVSNVYVTAVTDVPTPPRIRC